MASRERESRSRGFTLIEMLVVICIIGVLAGLLLPALLNAKERGYSAYCQNNLHQLAMAMRKYCMLYDGKFPAVGDYAIAGVWPYPVETMAKMMGYSADCARGDAPPKVILCPSCKATAANTGSAWACRNYAMNGHLDSIVHGAGGDYETRVGLDSFPGTQAWSQGTWGWWANFQPYSIDYVKCPERVAVFSDSVDEVDPGYTFWYPYYERICATVCYRCRPTRHMNGGNVGFLDGHVEHFSRSFFQDCANESQWLIDPNWHNSSAWWDSNFGT